MKIGREFGHEQTIGIDGEDKILIITKRGENEEGLELSLKVGKLVIREIGNVINEVAGIEMKKKICKVVTQNSLSDALVRVNFDSSLKYLTILVPAGRSRTCVYLELSDEGGISIIGGASVTNSIEVNSSGCGG